MARNIGLDEGSFLNVHSLVLERRMKDLMQRFRFHCLM